MLSIGYTEMTETQSSPQGICSLLEHKNPKGVLESVCYVSRFKVVLSFFFLTFYNLSSSARDELERSGFNWGEYC